MPNYTTNFHLVKPLPEEFYNIAVENGNMDILDTALKDLSDAIAGAGSVRTVANKPPDAAGNVALVAGDIPQADGRSIEAAQAAQDAAIDTLDVFSTVWPETSTSATVRTVYIPGVESLDQLINRPVWIQSGAAGAAYAPSTTLEVNGLGAKTVQVPQSNGNSMSFQTGAYWVNSGQPYCVVWSGSIFRLVSTNYPTATTARRGIVQLNDTLTSSATDQALTAKQGAVLATQIAGQEAQIMQMWDALFNDITSNPFLITFGDLNGITLTSGVWNRTLARLEC